MIGMAIHGGAGTLPRSEMGREAEIQYRAGLAEAIDAGFAVLHAGGSSMDAVTRAVVLLEDNPLFNAGRGSVFTLDGKNELDASIMDGSAVMEHSSHVMLAGAGAEEFAASRGFAFVPQSYFFTAERWRQLERIRSAGSGGSPSISHVGTVGAVALDSRGRLAAATSTGGMTGKRFHRVGDSPIIGAGTYADNRSCAVSATGHGEIFIRCAVAHDISARMRYGGRSLTEAVREVVLGELPAHGGEGGVVAIDAHGQIAVEFNSAGMFHATRRAGEEAQIGIYRPGAA